MKIITLDSELYPHRVVICIGERPSARRMEKICADSGLLAPEDDFDFECDGQAATWSFGCGTVVWLPPMKGMSAARWIATFTHELIHVLANASRHLGIHLNTETDEFHAYYAGWIVEQTLKRFRL